MKKILIPTDFSGSSRTAEEYAVKLAEKFEAEIQLLHVYREVMPAMTGPEPWSVVVSDLHIENEKLVNKEVAFLESKYKIKVKAEIRNGSKSRSITRFASEINADLIVMGIYIGKRSRILGSTVLNTVRKASIPVLIVPENTRFVNIKNITLAVDFNEMVNSRCFDLLFEFYKQFNCVLRVLHVEQRNADLKASELPGKLHLDLVLSRFTYEYNKIESNNVEEGIRNFIKNHPTDLLVMISHPHTLYERLFETIHTRSISWQLEKPMLVLKH